MKKHQRIYIGNGKAAKREEVRESWLERNSKPQRAIYVGGVSAHRVIESAGIRRGSEGRLIRINGSGTARSAARAAERIKPGSGTERREVERKSPLTPIRKIGMPPYPPKFDLKEEVEKVKPEEERSEVEEGVVEKVVWESKESEETTGAAEGLSEKEKELVGLLGAVQAVKDEAERGRETKKGKRGKRKRKGRAVEPESELLS